MWERCRYRGAVLLLALGFVMPVAMAAQVALPVARSVVAGAPALVLALPWRADAAAVVAMAGGRTLGPGPSGVAALAVFDADISHDRLQALGAWRLLDGSRLAVFCGGQIDG